MGATNWKLRISYYSALSQPAFLLTGKGSSNQFVYFNLYS